MRYRKERDYLGDIEVPFDAYWGVQTQRAVDNFPISGVRPYKEFITSLVLIKRAAAEANAKAGLLDKKKAGAIIDASDEIVSGKLMDQFVVDVYQAGAGTSMNMNANEVIANRASELLGGKKGDYSSIHPNDDVNKGQSTNDVIPTAIRISSLVLAKRLITTLSGLVSSLHKKAVEFDSFVKSGRTHLMDAAPIRLGQEFEAWSKMMEKDKKRIEASLTNLKMVNLGATAVGTGINADPRYVRYTIDILSKLTGFDLSPSEFLPEATESVSDFVELSSSIRSLAIDLTKICNDIRLMNSGPITGLGEITLPAVQPGSSIMPGKVNPSIIEMVNMVSFDVIGNDTAIMLAAQAGQLELNVMMPLIAFCLNHNLTIMNNACSVLTEKAITGIRADKKKLEGDVLRTPGVGLVLNNYIGYEKAAEVVKRALEEGRSVKDMAKKMKVLPDKKLDEIFNLEKMTK